MLSPGVKIAEYRLKKGWTQSQLCDRAGLAQANLSNIEKGKKDFTVSTLLRIAAALEVDPADFLTEKKSPCIYLNRNQIERLAKAVVDSDLKTSAEIRETANLFREFLGEGKKRAVFQKTDRSWIQLRQQFSAEEIQSICRRIEDARQRIYAKKTN